MKVFTVDARYRAYFESQLKILVETIREDVRRTKRSAGADVYPRGSAARARLDRIAAETTMIPGAFILEPDATGDITILVAPPEDS